MGSRPNAQPLASNEDSDLEVMDDSGNESGAEPVATADTDSTSAIKHSRNNEQDTDEVIPVRLTGSISSKSSSSTSKRWVTTATETTKKKGKYTKNTASVDALLHSYLGDDDDDDKEVDQNNSFKMLRVREVQAREREANARMIEAQAISGKAKSESELLSIQAKANLLRERKSLADMGISQEEIDEVLPLRKSK